MIFLILSNRKDDYFFSLVHRLLNEKEHTKKIQNRCKKNSVAIATVTITVVSSDSIPILKPIQTGSFSFLFMSLLLLLAGKVIAAAEMISGAVVSDELTPIEKKSCGFWRGDIREYFYDNSF
jgi:hypothetical protein